MKFLRKSSVKGSAAAAADPSPAVPVSMPASSPGDDGHVDSLSSDGAQDSDCGSPIPELPGMVYTVVVPI